jgi:exosortase
MTLKAYLYNYRFACLVTLILVSCLYSGIITDMAADWSRDENYSHGFLVPLIAGYFVYARWDYLKSCQIAPSVTGLIVIVFALIQLTIGSIGLEYFTMRSSLVVLIAGMALFFCGTELFRAVRLPVFYLLLMVPLPYIIYNALAFPLKQFVSWISVGCMKLIGVTVVRDGNIIMFPGISLEVADACSGMRSLVSILALSIAYAFFLQLTQLKRWIVILSSVLIAIVTNALRVIITGILASYHEFAGMAVFVLAMGEMINNIAHQWRQPLNNVALIVQSLQLAFKSGSLTDEIMSKDIANTMQMLLQMSGTIDDFRNFFSQEKVLQSFVVNEAVQRSLNFMLPALKNSGIIVQSEEQTDISADGFPGEYTQAVLNILSNAKDVLQDRAVAAPRITIRIFSENNRSVVTITDNGGGIPERILPQIFDPYFTTKQKGVGTGIGLFMSKMIMEKNMRGSLTACNTDCGAEFRIEL